MFQPEVKYRFVCNYCPPRKGWLVHVDIDGAEKGKTGGNRDTRQLRADSWKKIKKKFGKNHIDCNGRFKQWLKEKCPLLISNEPERLKFLRRRDILAFHPKRKIILVAEIESKSSEKEQAERKIYNAVGQLFRAIDELSNGCKYKLMVAVHGENLEKNLTKMYSGLKQLSITGVVLGKNKRWKKLLSNGERGKKKK